MSPNLHVGWSRLFARSLARAGVRDVVVSPGSRSTPLVLAIADEKSLATHVVIDERSAAFFALGQARVTGRPTALLCTSGTAGAHYFPAIIEAAESGVPLVAITADRPWEAYGASAPQTIDQTKLFGSYVRGYFELGLPDPTDAAIRAVPRLVGQAVARAASPTPGPVHVDARFRKPLEPVGTVDEATFPPVLRAELARTDPLVFSARRSVDDRALDHVAARVARTRRGLLVCGSAGALDAERRDMVVALAEASGFPVLAEPASQVRFGPAEPLIAGSIDAILRAPSLRAALAPEVLIEIGQPPVSGAYATFAAEHAEKRIVIAEHGHPDPIGGALVVSGPEVATIGHLADRLPTGLERSPFVPIVAEAERVVRAAIEAEIVAPELGEGVVAVRTAHALRDGDVLMLGNSSPIRDADLYARSPHAIRVLHQRGAAGIDGLVAGAAGSASAHDGRTLLVLGDVSLWHDLGSLAVAARARSPLAIVVVQNQGGRIFETLPIAARDDLGDAFPRFFLTDAGRDFSGVASLFGVAYARVSTVVDLGAALSQAWARGGCTVIEALVPPRAAIARRRALVAGLEARFGGAT